MTDERFSIDVLLPPDHRRAAMAADAEAGLTASPKTLPPVWFYDEHGSELFDEITRLPEYYPTRAERSILTERAAEIVDRAQANVLVELGSGTSDKTRLLLDAMADADRLHRFVPFDVSEETLRHAAADITAAYDIPVHAIVGDFHRHLGAIPRGERRIVAFLGSTIGNLAPEPRAKFLAEVASGLAPGDSLLLGTDLVKVESRLVAAYDDAEGVTAEFNRNVLRVLNRELDADFDVDAFAHVACWDPVEEWIEMRLRATTAQLVTIERLGMEVRFGDGEELRTEISAKFRRDGVARELAAAGLELAEWWTDPAGDFALSLSFPR
jgi:L-histidine Nalpha-methyltransferase